MRISEKKDKNSIQVKTDSGRVYVAFDNKREEECLKYAVHLLSNDLSKAVYKLEAGYLFIKKAGDEITLDARVVADDSEAKFEIDSFFEGRSAEVFDESEVPVVKKGLFSGKKFVFSIILAVIAASFCTVFYITEPGKYSGIVKRNVSSAPAPLMADEKEKLRVIGSRLVADKIGKLIYSVRPDIYTRISVLTAQTTEVPLSVSFIVTAGREYMYPESGSVSGRERGIWSRTETAVISLERRDIRPVASASFDACSIQMLGRGFYVRGRGQRCVDFVYDGDASKTVAAYNSIMGCYVSLNTLNIAGEKSALDVTLCRNGAMGYGQ